MAEVLLNMKGEIFPKPVFFEFFNVLFGRSIFFEGDYLAWKKHRKILNRVFQSGAMAKLTTCLHEKILSYCDGLETSVASPQRVDERLYSWNCDVVTHAVFGLKFKPTEIDLICFVNKQFFKVSNCFFYLFIYLQKILKYKPIMKDAGASAKKTWAIFLEFFTRLAYEHFERNL